MESFHFACPHCSGQFEVKHPPPGHAVACPHCGGGVALPPDMPLPVDAPTQRDESYSAEAPPAEPPMQTSGLGHAAAPVEPPQAFDFIEPPTIAASRPASPAAGQRVLPEMRRLSREEKERRRTVRNLVLMVVGVVVLVVATVVLSRV